MSVQPGPTFKRVVANGLASTFAIPFLLLDAADLQITLNGVLVTSGFTLSGIGNPTCSCTFAVNPMGDLLFQQVMVFQRLTDYQMNGDFLSPTVNRDYDRLWLAIKQLSRDSGRALTASLLEPEGIPPLPAKALRALKMLAFDGDGNPVTSNLTLEQLEQQPALAIEAVAQAQAAAGAAGGFADQALASAGAAAGAATASNNSAALAQKWADNPEDVPVTTGKFSARHWAAKAAASLSSLLSRVTNLESSLDFTILYPNGGSAATPANIVNNTRYVLPNPFPGYAVICILQVQVAGGWGTAGWFTDGSNARGAVAGQFNDSVVVQTGISTLIAGGGTSNSGAWCGTTHPGNIAQPATLPARVLVWKVKGSL